MARSSRTISWDTRNAVGWVFGALQIGLVGHVPAENGHTGRITAEIKGSGDGGVIDWEKLVNEAKKDAGGTVQLKLASKFNIDGLLNQFLG